jgi:diacylglycerol kinase family enzyme
MRAIAILNAKAGLVLQKGEAVANLVAEGFRAQGHAIDVTCVEPDAIEAAIDEVVARGDLDTLIIGGGDGTQSLAAAKLAGTSIALGILPFGTVNLLGRDLGIPLDVSEAVAAVGKAQPVRIDLAEVNGRLFHSLLGLGFFAKMASERQRARQHIPFARWLAFLLALARTLLRHGAMRIVIEADGKEDVRRSSAVLVTNNHYEEQPLHRTRIDQGKLEINIVRGAAIGSLLRAGMDLVAGRWRTRNSIEQIAATEVTIRMRRRQVRASIDGEEVELTTPLRLHIKPKALLVLRPERSEAKAT